MTEKKLKFEIGVSGKNLILILLSVLIAISIVNISTLLSITTEKSKKAAALEEQNRPANLQLIKIVDSSCINCFDIGQVVSFIEGNNVKITETESLEFSSTKSKELIEQFNIQKVPVLIVSGEIDKASIASIWAQVGGKQVDQSIYIESIPPYRNVTSGNVEGLVSLIMITDKSCNTCYNVLVHKQILLTFGVNVVSESTYDINSTEGKGLLNKYKITKVPTILLSKEAIVYPSLVQVWSQVGSIEADGQFVFRSVEQMGSYTDLSK